MSGHRLDCIKRDGRDENSPCVTSSSVATFIYISGSLSGNPVIWSSILLHLHKISLFIPILLAYLFMTATHSNHPFHVLLVFTFSSRSWYRTPSRLLPLMPKSTLEVIINFLGTSKYKQHCDRTITTKNVLVFTTHQTAGPVRFNCWFADLPLKSWLVIVSLCYSLQSFAEICSLLTHMPIRLEKPTEIFNFGSPQIFFEISQFYHELFKHGTTRSTNAARYLSDGSINRWKEFTWQQNLSIRCWSLNQVDT